MQPHPLQSFPPSSVQRVTECMHEFVTGFLNTLQLWSAEEFSSHVSLCMCNYITFLPPMHASGVYRETCTCSWFRSCHTHTYTYTHLPIHTHTHTHTHIHTHTHTHTHTQVDSQVRERLEPDISLEEEVQRNWAEIVFSKYHFDCLLREVGTRPASKQIYLCAKIYFSS